MINGLALLGWNPPQLQEAKQTKDKFSNIEVLTMDDLLKMVGIL